MCMSMKSMDTDELGNMEWENLDLTVLDFNDSEFLGCRSLSLTDGSSLSGSSRVQAWRLWQDAALE